MRFPELLQRRKGVSGSLQRRRRVTVFSTAVIALLSTVVVSVLSSCGAHTIGSVELGKKVYVELVDWHISGLWIFNCPICWIRVVNYNDVPVKEVRVRFKTFGYNGQELSEGTYTMEGTIGARSVKNFVEQTVGVVDLESDMLSIELDAVEPD
ncbi:MAG: hypothetical protein K2X93_26160 [Candidatus Obscuribacterales bacterium]|nr:hypothetical protein [Candidatus Obscuribacterales bacterium]